MKTKIIVVEDEPDIKEVIEYNLKREGFDVNCISDGEEALKVIKNERANLVLLDLMLPGIDGIEICRQLKSNEDSKNIPIIMVTAKGEESDIVLGLGVGADDYITKPFSPKELTARVKAVLRRGKLSQDSNQKDRIIEINGLIIDPKKFEIKINGQPVSFTATEFRLLKFLASNPGRVFSREQLLTQVIGDEAFVVDRNIDVHIRVIRKKLENYRDLIVTVRGVGYRFADREE